MGVSLAAKPWLLNKPQFSTALQEAAGTIAVEIGLMVHQDL
ncbi:hypothetical protein [Roseofilum sp. Guam]|nr:hypothetical protein [Roseofilum sp. Guam]